MGATIESLEAVGSAVGGEDGGLARPMHAIVPRFSRNRVCCVPPKPGAITSSGSYDRLWISVPTVFLEEAFFSLTTSATCIGNVRTKGDGTSSGFPESFEAALLLGGGRLRFGPAVPGHHEFGDGKHHTRVFHLLLHVLSKSQSKRLTIVLTRVLQ